MCGIFAYIGGRPVLITLIKGLRRLEYRGYDGAGVGILNKNDLKITVVKTAGTVKALEDLLETPPYESIIKNPDNYFMGLAHTRWPTMGLPTDVNTHPFLSNDKKWVVILNGIIENSNDLTNFMKSQGYKFESENDVEVIGILMEYLAKTKGGDTLSLFVTMLSMIVGAYAVVIMHEGEKQMYCARLSSPLCLGIGNKELFVASDPIAFREYTENVIHLDDFEVCVADAENQKVYKLTQNFSYTEPLSEEQSKARIVAIPFEPAEFEIGDYPHFMLKEIYQQPTVVQQTFAGKINNVDSIHITYPNPLRRIYFLACGTSYYAALVGKHIIEQQCGIEVCTEYASEFIYSRCMCGKNDLAIAVSQSGETADTREALNIAKRNGASLAGIVNVVGSQIARLAGQGMYLHAGAEIGVASTKAFTCQVCATILLSAFLAKDPEYTAQIQRDLRRLPNAMQRILASTSISATIDAIVSRVKNAKSALFLGRGIDYPLAMEGALKMKEISYIHAEGYPAGEMKHGPIALVDKDMPCFFVLGASKETQYTKVLNNMEEIKTRQGIIITITDAPEMHTAIHTSASSSQQYPSPGHSPAFFSSSSSSGGVSSPLSCSPANYSPSLSSSSSKGGIGLITPIVQNPQPLPPSSSTSVAAMIAGSPSQGSLAYSSLGNSPSSPSSGSQLSAAVAASAAVTAVVASRTTSKSGNAVGNAPSPSPSPTTQPTPSINYTAFSSDPEDVDRVTKLSDYVIRVPHISEYTSPMLMVIPLQLLAYKIAVAKGLNPDRPRNLAKSVTVE